MSGSSYSISDESSKDSLESYYLCSCGNGIKYTWKEVHGHQFRDHFNSNSIGYTEYPAKDPLVFHAFPKSLRRQGLEKTADIVDGDRNVQYGDPNADFETIAAFWNIFLGRVWERFKFDHDPESTEVNPFDDGLIKPEHVAVMMGHVKDSRISWSPEKEDHWLDKMGYAACGYDIIMRNQ